MKTLRSRRIGTVFTRTGCHAQNDTLSHRQLLRRELVYLAGNQRTAERGDHARRMKADLIEFPLGHLTEPRRSFHTQYVCFQDVSSGLIGLRGKSERRWETTRSDMDHALQMRIVEIEAMDQRS